MKIIGSVGKGGVNLNQDTELILIKFKELNFNFTENLNSHKGYELIKFFQSIIHNVELNKKDRRIDGRIDPGFITEKWLFSDNAPKIIELKKMKGLITYPFKKNYILSWYFNPLKNIIINSNRLYKKDIYIYTKLSTKKVVKDYYKIYIFIRESDDYYDYVYNSLRRYFLLSKEKFYILIEGLIKVPYLKVNNLNKYIIKGEKINNFINDSHDQEIIKNTINNKNINVKYEWLEIAKKEIGVKEKIGSKNNNKRILEYLQTCSSQYKTDEIPWCAAFLKWCFKKASLSTFRLTAAARSFSQSNSLIKLNGPYYGSIVVFKYNNNTRWSGHVGILIDIDNSNLKILGGNQTNQVKYSYFSSDKVYGYYWPKSVKLPSVTFMNNKKKPNIKITNFTNTR